MTQSKPANWIAFLTALGATVAPALLDPQQTLTGKIAVVAVTALLLLVRTDKLVSQRTAILGGLAVVAAVIAGVAGKFSPGTAGFAIVGCVGAVFAQIRVLLAAKIPETAAALLVGLGLLTLAPAARADGLVLQLSDTVTCSPVGMLTGYQYNTATKTFQKGVGLGAGYGCRYTGWKVPLGANLVGGATINENAPNAGQGSLIFTVADNYGFGPGAQVFKDPVDRSWNAQLLLSFFLTGSWAATIEQLITAKQRAVQAERVRLQGAR